MESVSIPALADAVGLSRNAVWLHVRKGHLRAHRVVGLRSRWRVRRSDACAYAAQMGIDLELAMLAITRRCSPNKT